MSIESLNYLKELLNVYWLRPEVALWRTFDCALMEKYRILPPSLDMGSGDGVLSYIMAGGDFHPEFDIYRFIEKTDKFRKGQDIYNGICDYKSFVVSEKSRPRHQYSVCIDNKINLLKKSLLIPGFYKSAVQYDLNNPLSFKPETFQTIFSNILSWLEDIDAVLSGIHQALRKGGRLYIFVPNDNFKEMAWICHSEKFSGDYSYLNYINRGYTNLIRHFYSKDKWAKIFKRSGLTVIEHKQYISKPIIEIWQVGTRPISHLLINMSKKLTGADRTVIKEEWVDFFYSFFTPLIKFAWESDKTMESVFHFFALEKK